jgi:hypothetical protein
MVGVFAGERLELRPSRFQFYWIGCGEDRSVFLGTGFALLKSAAEMQHLEPARPLFRAVMVFLGLSSIWIGLRCFSDRKPFLS